MSTSLPKIKVVVITPWPHSDGMCDYGTFNFGMLTRFKLHSSVASLKGGGFRVSGPKIA